MNALLPNVTVYYNQQSGAQDPGAGGPSEADRVQYDNANSGMQAVNVQQAIDQLDDRLDGLTVLKGIREIADPAYTIQATDNGFLLKWRGGGPANWTLPAGIVAGFECLTLRCGVGDLKFTPAAGATRECGLDSPAGAHNGIAYRLGYGHLLVDTNATASSAAWVLAGATAVIP